MKEEPRRCNEGIVLVTGEGKEDHCNHGEEGCFSDKGSTLPVKGKTVAVQAMERRKLFDERVHCTGFNGLPVRGVLHQWSDERALIERCCRCYPDMRRRWRML